MSDVYVDLGCSGTRVGVFASRGFGTYRVSFLSGDGSFQVVTNTAGLCVLMAQCRDAMADMAVNGPADDKYP